MEHKFTFQELWEIAFHNLARLEFRQAYVVIKGVFDHTELIRTTDTPYIEKTGFPYARDYLSLATLEKCYDDRRDEIENVLKERMTESQIDKDEEEKAVVALAPDLKFLKE
jgi:hypothetical protein